MATIRDLVNTARFSGMRGKAAMAHKKVKLDDVTIHVLENAWFSELGLDQHKLIKYNPWIIRMFWHSRMKSIN